MYSEHFVTCSYLLSLMAEKLIDSLMKKEFMYFWDKLPLGIFFFFLDKSSIGIICHLCHLSVSSCSMLIFLVRQKYLSAQLFLPFYNFMVNDHKNLWNQKYKGTTKKREKREKNNSNRIIHVQAVINLLVPLDKQHIIEMHNSTAHKTD